MRKTTTKKRHRAPKPIAVELEPKATAIKLAKTHIVDVLARQAGLSNWAAG